MYCEHGCGNRSCVPCAIKENTDRILKKLDQLKPKPKKKNWFTKMLEEITQEL